MYVDAAVYCGGYDVGGDQYSEGNGDNEVWGWTGGSNWELIKGEFEF